MSPVLKLTPRQAEVMANLTRVTTDGCRHDPMFWLGEKNVSVQVRSLRAGGRVELREGRLVESESPVVARPSAPDTEAAVNMMRELLAGDRKKALATGGTRSTMKARSP